MRGARVFGVFAGRSLAVPAGLALALMLLGIGTGAASAATPDAGWTIASFAVPANFSPADSSTCMSKLSETAPLCDSYQVSATNAGAVPSTGPTVITDTVPAGLTVVKLAVDTLPFRSGGGFRQAEEATCAQTGQKVVCSNPHGLAPDEELKLFVYVTVDDPNASGLLPANTASVSGSGLREATVSRQNSVSSTPAPFGPSSFDLYIAGANGEPDTQAGDHPYELTTTIDLNSKFRPGAADPSETEAFSVEDVKDIALDLPLGFVGSVLAAPRCTLAQLSSSSTPCPPDTQIGYIYTEPANGSGVNSAIYNLTPERGVPAELGFVDALHTTHVFYMNVVPTPQGYALQTTSPDIPQEALSSITITFYGDPAVRDKTAGAQIPFFTNPTDCDGGPLVATMYMDSWQNPGTDNPDGSPDLNDPAWVKSESVSPPVTGCNALQFSPELSTQPTTAAADSPTGLELELRSPSSEVPAVNATPPLRTAVVTLPDGLTVDPSAGDGLQACSVAQVGWLGPDGPGGEPLPNKGLTNFTGQEPACPEQSQVGSLELTTPLFSSVLTGTVYLAAQDENPFQSALAVYLVVEDPTTGVVLKLPAELRADPHTGRLTVVLAESPQLPFSDLKLHFNSGPRALLATPDGCGAYTTTSELTPWSALGSDPGAEPFDAFQVDAGCVGGFAPSFVAGVTNVQAGAYTPFEASFAREDTDRELGGWSVSLPPGLLANLSSVPLCQAAAPSAGSCPEASRVGTVIAEAGPGPNPLQVTGKAYLTGPYNGGPFGLSVVVPVIAGPLELGTVVVRQSLRIDPRTAQITDASNPFPTLLDVTGANGQTDGIPIRLRRVDVTFERPGGAPFMFNPTSCAKLPLTGSISSAQGASAPVSSPFQVTDCASLKFDPRLTAVTRANGELAGHGASLHLAITAGASASGASASTSSAGLTATSTAEAQANIRSLKLDLPQRLPARLETIQRACPESTFDANPAACPKAAVVGSASVQTPILSATMSGPAYLVSKNGSGTTHPGESKVEKEEAAFPDLVLVLQGEGVKIDLTGALFVSANNITSVAFRAIPDVPIRRLDLVLPEGKGSILAASAGLCTKKPLTMATAITGQDGARVKPTVKVAVSGCKKPKKRRPAKRKYTG